METRRIEEEDEEEEEEVKERRDYRMRGGLGDNGDAPSYGMETIVEDVEHEYDPGEYA